MQYLADAIGFMNVIMLCISGAMAAFIYILFLIPQISPVVIAEATGRIVLFLD